MRLPLPAAVPTAVLASLALALPAGAQTGFSIDFQGPTIGVPDSATLTPITEADVLAPFAPGGLPALGPLPPPGIAVTGGPGGVGLPMQPLCIGHPPGTICLIEVDALSDGNDYDLNPMGVAPNGGDLWFSVDPFAVGLPHPFFPSLGSEFPVADAPADVFTDIFLLPGPLPPFAVPPSHVGAIDGDGLPSGSGFTYPGLGLREPNPPGPPPTIGDDLDALELKGFPAGAPLWFSLDSAFPDPLTGFPNCGSAAANGVVGGDVLLSFGGPPVPFAPAGLLGLDLIGGPDSDDLDALLLLENGSGAFEPSMSPYDWATGATDMLLFSVRRGSAVIGAPDSIFGLPIEEGDVLTTPLPTFLGGVSPFPGIFVAAENLGLATVRSFPVPFGDDVDALDSLNGQYFDCDGDGVEDSVAIATGLVADLDRNGVPDSCQPVGTPYCFCPVGPCLNNDPAAGCLNSTGAGALLTGTGSSSVVFDNLVLTTTSLPTNQFGIYYFGTNAINVPFGDGIRCVGGTVARFPVQSTGPAGVMVLGPGIVNYACTNLPPVFCIVAFQTWRFQCWYRDPLGPCGNGFNFSNAIAVTFTP